MKKSFEQPAFTLAELLIALAILGVIATFTIPKILDSGSDSKYEAMAKEVSSMISGAYSAYKLQNTPSGSTSSSELTPYLNYVKVDTTTTIDNNPTAADLDCSAGTSGCLLLHNGGMLWYRNPEAFGTSDTTSAILYVFDPDAQASSIKSVKFFLYFNGRMTDISNIPANTRSTIYTHNPCPACAAPWFNWSN